MTDPNHHSGPNLTGPNPAGPNPTGRNPAATDQGAGVGRARLGRRDLLKLGAAGAAGLTLAGGASAGRAATAGTSARGASRRRAKARNVIFLVVDGMSQGIFTLGDMVTRHYRDGTPSAWMRLYQDGAPMSQCRTASADSLVTDSAAASCAWATGVHINNGAINVHEGRELKPILLTAKEAGKSTGLVTTTRVTHATPAGFVANVPSRNMENQIARQILDREVDVVLGGGARHFPGELIDSRRRELSVLRSRDELLQRALAPDERRLLGLFSESHMDYALDRPADQPQLFEMALAAVRRLDRNPEGFVLQIEAGRVDHGGHGTDAIASIYDQAAFDVTIERLREWARDRDDTLIIITTDHGCGGPELTVYGQASHDGFDRVVNARHTMTHAMRRMGTGPDRVQRLASELNDAMRVELSGGEVDWLERVLNNRERASGFDGMNGDSAAVATVLANHLGINFVSGNHTGEMVHATALGPGAERIRPSMDNIDLYDMAVQAAALEA